MINSSIKLVKRCKTKTAFAQKQKNQLLRRVTEIWAATRLIVDSAIICIKHLQLDQLLSQITTSACVWTPHSNGFLKSTSDRFSPGLEALAGPWLELTTRLESTKAYWLNLSSPALLQFNFKKLVLALVSETSTAGKLIVQNNSIIDVCLLQQFDSP